jgi:hypothetical protein
MEERGPFTTTLTPPSRTILPITIELPPHTTVAEVEAHNDAVRRPSVDRARYRKLCGRCGHRGTFKPHELRRRSLRLIVEHTVLCVTIWLARWRCWKCRYVFTDYPDFRTSL